MGFVLLGAVGIPHSRDNFLWTNFDEICIKLKISLQGPQMVNYNTYGRILPGCGVEQCYVAN